MTEITPLDKKVQEKEYCKCAISLSNPCVICGKPLRPLKIRSKNG